MTSRQQLICDSSTLANFKQWAMAISQFFAAAGWIQTADTGQVNWSTLSAVPGAGAFVLEYWRPGDGLTPVVVKVRYGNAGSSTNCPCVSIGFVGSTTDGAGGPGPGQFGQGDFTTALATFTPPSTSVAYECNFSGSPSRIAIMLWRNGTGNCQQFFALERSVDPTGAYTGSYVSLWTLGPGPSSYQTSFSPVYFAGLNLGAGCWAVRLIALAGYSSSWMGMIPFDTCAPFPGFFDYPCTVVGIGSTFDYPEAVPFTVNLYAQPKTYLPSGQGAFANAGPSGAAAVLCMRYD
jgi:hypothetical protein